MLDLAKFTATQKSMSVYYTDSESAVQESPGMKAAFSLILHAFFRFDSTRHCIHQEATVENGLLAFRIATPASNQKGCILLSVTQKKDAVRMLNPSIIC